MIAELKERTVTTARQRAVKAGKVPRRAYAHYFIEAEGIHSRIHLQNFWSTFWPQLAPTAVATIHVFDAEGTAIGEAIRRLAPFSSVFVEMRDLLAEFGARADEGLVAVDLAPPDDIRAEMAELPNPLKAEVNTPYWMAYYDSAENYMYVHSIEKLGGEVCGTTMPLRWLSNRSRDLREPWRSWRLLELDDITEVQIVAVNHSNRPGSSTVGLYGEPDRQPIYDQRLDFKPRQLHRVRIAGYELRDALAARPEARYGRVGLDPLLTGNGKPYVLLRYGNGPLSLHHG